MAGQGSKSKKRSAASSAPKPPESFVFFIDQCLGRRVVADALRNAGMDVRLLEDHFPAEVSDDEWLREVGSRNWIVLSKDRRIRRRPTELASLMKGNTRAFLLTAGNIRGEDMASAFVLALPRIKQFVRDFPAPFIAAVTESGSVRMLMRRSDISYKAQVSTPPASE